MTVYAPAVVFTVLLAVIVLRHFAPKTPKWLLPYAAVALGVGGGVLEAALTVGVTMDAVWIGTAEGLAACGLWSGFGKHVYKGLGLHVEPKASVNG